MVGLCHSPFVCNYLYNFQNCPDFEVPSFWDPGQFSKWVRTGAIAANCTRSRNQEIYSGRASNAQLRCREDPRIISIATGCLDKFFQLHFSLSLPSSERRETTFAPPALTRHHLNA
jgi:hypothetical protein